MRNYILTALIFCSLNIFAQTGKAELINKIVYNGLDENYTTAKVPDSVGFYAFAIKVDVS